jgi:PPOX class probable F420-dependent enzyme
MVRIPDSHRHLLEGNVDVILTTISKNGFPHSSMIWCSYDGENVLLNTGVGYQKERNMRRNSNVSVFAYDPKNPYVWISISGAVELVEEGAFEHLNKLCYKYTGKEDFYRDLMPELTGEKRVIIRLTPTKVQYGGSNNEDT